MMWREEVDAKVLKASYLKIGDDDVDGFIDDSIDGSG